MEDESESESDSDSDSEPAPPGEEMVSSESKGEEELLPPGVEAEPTPVDASIQLPTSSSGTDNVTKTAPANKLGMDQPVCDIDYIHCLHVHIYHICWCMVYMLTLKIR